MKSPISLALFTTTKGHFDFTNIYKSTINDLFYQVGQDLFADRIVHIKRGEGEDNHVYEEMVRFFKLFDFKILTTVGKWKHYDQSHYNEHVRDIITLMSDATVQKNKYVLWLEDDFLLRTKDDNVLGAFKDASDVLDSDPNILSVRFLKNLVDTDEMQMQRLQYERQFNDKIFLHNDVYTFDPNLIRSRDAWTIARGFERFGLRMHIERQATEMLRQNVPSRKTAIFSAFNLNYAKAFHIGDETFFEGKEKTIKFT